MTNMQEKREQEKRLVSQMIALYCKKKHHSRDELCEECKELSDYARERSDKCPFMETKTFCSSCSVHCYQPKMRERMKSVMRFSGPRIIICHPIIVIRHWIEGRKK